MTWNADLIAMIMMDAVVEPLPLAGVLLALGLAQPCRTDLLGYRVKARLTLLPEAAYALR